MAGRDLFSISEEIRRCTRCPLWKERTLAVPGDGPSNAQIMLVGEAPGAHEDREGLPFIGRSGVYLKTSLSKVRIDPATVFITSAVKCHPPKNRVPTVAECGTCRDTYLISQISLIKPKLIILVGGVSVRTLLGTSLEMKELHGKIIVREGVSYFVLHHPSAALRFPAIRLMFEKDLVELGRVAAKMLK